LQLTLRLNLTLIFALTRISTFTVPFHVAAIHRICGVEIRKVFLSTDSLDCAFPSRVRPSGTSSLAPQPQALAFEKVNQPPKRSTIMTSCFWKRAFASTKEERAISASRFTGMEGCPIAIVRVRARTRCVKSKGAGNASILSKEKCRGEKPGSRCLGLRPQCHFSLNHGPKENYCGD